MLYLVDGDQLSIQFLREPLQWDLRSTRMAYYPIILILFILFLENFLGKNKFKIYTKNVINFMKNKIKKSIDFKI